ncbi:respirasome Complex Assembly Factor 1-like [Amphibalanus amphitrite]|uniref:respirasome Complex Assembly Factor 1-like n=1 Tax=Amphibalanus amphitrite TaxID=1232801 RepID=UPI001C91AFE1|nr:respirasome Complex Assembly Factor 1-like [Amphibalanus amphitrite]
MNARLKASEKMCHALQEQAGEAATEESADGRQGRPGSYAGAVIDVSTQLDSNVVQAAETPTNHQQPEDVEATVVTLLNSTFPGLNMQTSDIDRAHRSTQSGVALSSQDEFLDVIYWLRQVLGIIIGLVWGILPMQGFLGLALFFFVSSIIIYIYFQSFQGVDEDDFGGFSELVKEGCMTSFAGFLVTWIITYSGLHYG